MSEKKAIDSENKTKVKECKLEGFLRECRKEKVTERKATERNRPR